MSEGNAKESEALGNEQGSNEQGRIAWKPWGYAGGHAVTLYTLTTPGGVQAQISTHGGALVSLFTPDRHGTLGDIVLGHETLEPYLNRDTAPYFGALIGRYGNRIAGGQFSLDGHAYALTRNEPPNTLHGGAKGFDLRLWAGRPLMGQDGPALELTYTSPDGEEGFPGTLTTTVTYTLSDHELRLDYRMETDIPTVVNPTNHSYWNLSGNAQRDILEHELTVQAESFTPVGPTLIPTGELRPVAGTPFDFGSARPVGARVNDGDEQLIVAGGYDHNFVLRAHTALDDVATLYDPESGRILSVRTTEPGLQVYSGNFLDGTIVGKGGVRYEKGWAMCLETQHFPDSPNQPTFPSTRLEPGKTFTSRTVYRFDVR